MVEGKPLIITISADDSVRSINIVAWSPLPAPQAFGDNRFEITIPKNVPPGRYNITAVGMTSALVESEPVSVQVERDDPPTGLQVNPPLLSFAELEHEYGYPISVVANFADGSHLDVTHSSRTSFTPKNAEIARVDDQARVIPIGPGETIIVVNYAASGSPGSATTAMLVRCPLPKPAGPAPEIDSAMPETGVPGITDITIRGRHFGETQGKSFVSIGTQNGVVKRWTDTEIVATVGERAHRGAVAVFRDRQYSNLIPFTPVGLLIDAISGMPVPGNKIRIQGSGFESEQGSGYVTVADIRADVVQWNSTAIVVTVPDFSPSGSTFQLAVHQDGKSAEFRLITPRQPAAR